MEAMETEETKDVVALLIEGRRINVRRSDLVTNSDYFKAMFQGNFVESQKTEIELQDVNPDAMSKLLKLLWDKEIILSPDDLIEVLDVACMLQFLEIKMICTDRLLSILSFANCLKMWFGTERLALEQVYLRAKLVAVLEFTLVKEIDAFIELSLNELCTYLGSVYLQTPSELVVFESFMKWCDQNGENSTDALLRLLYCLNFNQVSEKDIQKMMGHPIITQCNNITGILLGILHIRNDGRIVENNVPQADINIIHSLLRSKNRNVQGFPCILLDNLGVVNENVVEKNCVFYYDKFKRKRKCEVLDNNSSNNDLSLISFDPTSKSLKSLVDVESQKFVSLDGFKVVGYQQYFFMFGGEGLLGKGDWNTKFVQYDVVNDIWKEKTKFPFSRRHFESCVCGNNLYVIGGTGPFRIIQENMFWYAIKEQKWCRKEEKLPCLGRQIKCCCFNGSLFLLNINSRLGYLYVHQEARWQPYDIVDSERQLPNYSQRLCVFSYKNDLYIKDQTLIQLKLVSGTFVIVKKLDLPRVQTIDVVESVFCDNILYSLTKKKCEDANEYVIALEAFDLETCESFNIVTRTTSEVFELNNKLFKFRSGLNIFNVFHHCLLHENVLVNNC